MPVFLKNFFLFLLLIFLPKLFVSQDTSDWFALEPDDDFSESVIDMRHWLDAPAGKHGIVQMQGNQFVFEDGTPVKFWGVNIASGRVFAEKDVAEQWAMYLAKYGVNAVRFHKFTRPALQGNTSTELNPDKLAQLDYFSEQLRQKGIYYGWSHIYGHKPKPGDKDQLLAYEEITNFTVPWAHLNGATSGLVNFAPDLQDLHIALTVNMLNHKNPYTGLRYADDPALNFIELQNEDNIFWGAVEKVLEQTPTYRALLCEQFSEWLKEKYGSQTALEAAWGEEALETDETLDKMNIYPHPNHAWFDGQFFAAKKDNRPVPQHVLDKANFLYETQMQFYQKFTKAIRETGYKGPIVASCWQAGSGLTHFMNLHADYETGFIDRHNYYGGGTGHGLKPGNVNNQAMVSQPGSGLLSTGMQMINERPFVFSEWMSKIPNEWVAEAPVLIAAYGMGLQGWDGSYIYASNAPHLTGTLESPHHGTYNADAISQMGLFPVLARMIYRNDVQEGKSAALLKTNIQQIKQGKIGFEQEVAQGHDVKSFTGEIPTEALAIGKVAIDFTQGKTGVQQKNIARHWNKETKVITSNTGQLQWNYAGKGYVTIDTEGTQAVLGFAQNTPIPLSDVEIQSDASFSMVSVSSLEKDKNIDESERLLVTTLARSRNTNMQYNEDGSELLATGKAPLLLEPVQAKLQFSHKKSGKVHVLDHVGRKKGVAVPFKNGKIVLDGQEYQTLYYLIEFAE